MHCSIQYVHTVLYCIEDIVNKENCYSLLVYLDGSISHLQTFVYCLQSTVQAPFHHGTIYTTVSYGKVVNNTCLLNKHQQYYVINQYTCIVAYIGGHLVWFFPISDLFLIILHDIVTIFKIKCSKKHFVQSTQYRLPYTTVD